MLSKTPEWVDAECHQKITNNSSSELSVIILNLSNTTLMKRLNQGFWKKKERPGSSAKRNGSYFIFSLHWAIILNCLSLPETLGRRVQLRPARCSQSWRVSQCSGVQSPLHIHKHKCTAPQRCLSPQPHSPASWQTQARKLSIPIAFKAM